MNRGLFYLAVMLCLGSCGPTSGGDNDKHHLVSIWDNLSSRWLLGWEGDIKEVVCYIDDGNFKDDPSTPDYDESQVRCMHQKFNDKGQIIAFNPTPFDHDKLEPTLTKVSGRISDSFAQSTASYEYSYDGLGRITEVVMYDVAMFGFDPVTYTVTYGDHLSFVVAPFVVGTLPIYLLRGVASIESSFGYSMFFEGDQATEIYPSLGWGNPARRAIQTIVGEYPQSIVFESMMVGDQGEDVVVNRTTELYKWSEVGVLLKADVEVVVPSVGGGAAEESSLESIVYSREYPLKPTNHVWSVNGEVDAAYYYKYNEDGLLYEGAYRTGPGYPNMGSYTPVSFAWDYTTFDSSENWIAKSQDIWADGQFQFVMSWEQTITYFSVN